MKRLLNRVVRKIAYQKFYTKKNIDYANKFQYLPSQEIEKIQLEKLKRIVKIAIDTVPFYMQFRNEINIEEFTLKDLNLFPVIDKNIMRENLEDFVSTKYKGILSNTSGSTGVPFKFYLPFEGAALENINVHRAWNMGEDFCYEFGDPILVLRSYVPKEGESITKIDKKRNHWYMSPFHINKESLQIYIPFIESSRAKLIRGYASSIYIFTLLLKDNNIKIPQIKAIYTSSEALLPKYREVIEEYWGMKVLDYYGQNENVVSVQQCWAGNYHNNDDYGIVEIDECKNIIGTSLNNYVMPFIRYNTLDKAIIKNGEPEVCECGRTLSKPFQGVDGRSDDILIKSDGTHIPTANFSTAMKGFKELKQFQIIQNEDLSIELNLVVNDVSKNYLDKIEYEVIKRLGDVEVTINKLEEIQRDIKTGKLKVTIQNNKII